MAKSDPHDGLAVNRQVELEGAAMIPEGTVKKLKASLNAQQLLCKRNTRWKCSVKLA